MVNLALQMESTLYILRRGASVTEFTINGLRYRKEGNLFLDLDQHVQFMHMTKTSPFYFFYWKVLEMDFLTFLLTYRSKETRAPF